MKSNNNVNVNIKQDSKKDTVFSHISNLFFDKIANAKWSKIIKVYIVSFIFLATFVILYFGYRAASDNEIVKNAALKMSQSEENIRDFVVTPKIQHELEVLVYSLNADRAFIFELHNGKKNTSGLPFRFADMSYEITNDDKRVDKVALEFQNIPLTLYKYPHYLQKKKLMIGTVEEIETIDVDFAEHIKNIGGKYLGMIYLNNNGVPIAFLCVSYHDLEEVPKKEVIELKLREYGKMVTSLLDLQEHKK